MTIPAGIKKIVLFVTDRICGAFLLEDGGLLLLEGPGVFGYLLLEDEF